MNFVCEMVCFLPCDTRSVYVDTYRFAVFFDRLRREAVMQRVVRNLTLPRRPIVIHCHCLTFVFV